MLQTGAVARATGNAIDELGPWIGNNMSALAKVVARDEWPMAAIR
jgi:hypothetical protein